MYNFTRLKLIACLLCIFAMFFLSVAGMAQSKKQKPPFDLLDKTMKFPHQYKIWRIRTSAGLSMVVPPFDVVENYIQAPLVNIEAVMGMPAGFSLNGGITSIVVSNQVTLGPKWNYRYRNFGFNIGYDLGFVIGWMNVGGFNNTGIGLIHYPNLSIGFKTKPVAFTFKGEAVILGYRSIRSGSVEVSKKYTAFDGITYAIYIEQRLWKNKLFIIGLKDNYVKQYWPIWMLFSTFDRYYHVPELYFSWTL